MLLAQTSASRQAPQPPPTHQHTTPPHPTLCSSWLSSVSFLQVNSWMSPLVGPPLRMALAKKGCLRRGFGGGRRGWDGWEWVGAVGAVMGLVGGWRAAVRSAYPCTIGQHKAMPVCPPHAQLSQAMHPSRPAHPAPPSPAPPSPAQPSRTARALRWWQSSQGRRCRAPQPGTPPQAALARQTAPR